MPPHCGKVQAAAALVHFLFGFLQIQKYKYKYQYKYLTNTISAASLWESASMGSVHLLFCQELLRNTSTNTNTITKTNILQIQKVSPHWWKVQAAPALVHLPFGFLQIQIQSQI